MRELLAAMPSESVDAVATDPPYGLAFMGKAWDQQVPGPDYWREVLRVLKPGGHMVAFGGTRTAHRLACAIEDAGFDLRDCVSWLYGSGFPKSHDVSKAIDREAGAERCEGVPGRYASRRPRERVEAVSAYQDGVGNASSAVVTVPATESARAWDGWGTALKPAWEPIYLARKPFKCTVAQSVLEHGCGALNIDGCRIGSDGATRDAPSGNGTRSNQVYGTYGACKTVPLELGRWPANLVLDEEAARLLDAQTGERGGGPSRFFYVAKASRSEREAGLEHFEPRIGSAVTGRKPGSAGAQSAYAGTTESARRNTHPTVKPVSLMRWLVRLITPPGGIVLDPFTGSGSTGVAAVLEGARFIGCELSPEFAEIARARIAHAGMGEEMKAEYLAEPANDNGEVPNADP